MHGPAPATKPCARAPAEAPLRVVHLAQSDREGGANRAAFRLHSALRAAGVEFHVSLRPQARSSGDVVEAAPDRGASQPPRLLHTSTRVRCAPIRAEARSRFRRSNSATAASMPPCWRAPTSCALHWIAGAFLTPAQLARIGRPLVWRLSDQWPFTGGCHYSGSCRRFESDCGRCPVLGSTQDADLSRRDFALGTGPIPIADLTIVAPSRWIANEARRSSLFGGTADRTHSRPGSISQCSSPRSAARRGARSGSRWTARSFCLARSAPRRPAQGLSPPPGGLGRVRRRPRAGDATTVVVFGAPEAALGDDLPFPAINVGRIDGRARSSRTCLLPPTSSLRPLARTTCQT